MTFNPDAVAERQRDHSQYDSVLPAPIACKCHSDLTATLAAYRELNEWWQGYEQRVAVQHGRLIDENRKLGKSVKELKAENARLAAALNLAHSQAPAYPWNEVAPWPLVKQELEDYQRNQEEG